MTICYWTYRLNLSQRQCSYHIWENFLLIICSGITVEEEKKRWKLNISSSIAKLVEFIYLIRKKFVPSSSWAEFSGIVHTFKHFRVWSLPQKNCIHFIWKLGCIRLLAMINACLVNGYRVLKFIDWKLITGTYIRRPVSWTFGESIYTGCYKTTKSNKINKITKSTKSTKSNKIKKKIFFHIISQNWWIFLDFNKINKIKKKKIFC